MGLDFYWGVTWLIVIIWLCIRSLRNIKRDIERH